MVDVVAETNFPRVTRYLARLPQGFASYPTCLAHASVLQTLAFSRTLRRFPWGQVAPEVADALRGGVNGATWVSEVLFNAVMLTLADHQRYTDDEVMAWLNEANQKLLGGKARREAVEAAAGRLDLGAQVRRMTDRFADFHRGVGIGVHLLADKPEAFLNLTYPPFAIDPLVSRGIADALQLALSMSQRAAWRVGRMDIGPRQAEFQLLVG